MKKFTKTPHRAADLVQTITPEEAQHLLGTVRNNRNVRSSKVREYADDLRNGRWNPYTIIRLDPEGRLLDGQHRLSACVAADMDIEVVLLEVPEEDLYTTDIGLKRTLADQLKIKNEELSNAAEVASVLTAYYGWDDELKDYTPVKGSTPKMMEFFNEDPSRFIDSALRARRVYNKLWRDNIPASIAMIGAAYLVLSDYAEDSQMVDAFFDEWHSGSYTSSEPLGVLDTTLRNQMKDYGSFNNVVGRRKVLALIVKAWNAWSTGNEVKSLRFNTGGPKARRESFPKIHPGPALAVADDNGEAS